MLGGIVVNNAILLVDQSTRLVREGMPTRDALVEAGGRRMSACTQPVTSGM